MWHLEVVVESYGHRQHEAAEHGQHGNGDVIGLGPSDVEGKGQRRQQHRVRQEPDKLHCVVELQVHRLPNNESIFHTQDKKKNQMIKIINFTTVKTLDSSRENIKTFILWT